MAFMGDQVCRIAFGLLPVALLLAQPTPHYTVITVAGSDPVRDGGAAMEAILNSATGLAFDRDGNLYIADAGANRIRKVTTDTNQLYPEAAYAFGLISTAAGRGVAFFSGDQGPA